MRVHFDHDPVGARGYRGAGHGDHLVAQPGTMRRVGDDRQVRELVHHRDGREVEEVAGRRVEAADAALAQNHVVVPLGQEVLGGQEELLDRRRQAALQEHRLPGAAGRLEEREVLHVARADLDDVRDFPYGPHAFGVHRLRADQEARLFARFGQKPQSGSPQALERIGRGAGLPGAAAEDHGASLLHLAGRLEDLALGLDGARPRDGRDLRAAHGDAAREANHGVLLLPLAAHLFVGLGDVDDVLHPRQRFQTRCVHAAVVPHQADGGALGAGHGAGLVAHFLDHRDDALDLGVRGAAPHHDQHCEVPPMVKRSPSRAAVTGPPKRVPAARAGSEVSTGG